MEKNRIRPITSGKKFSHELFQTKRSIRDAESNRSPERFLSVVSG